MIFVDYCRFYKISPAKNVTQSTNHVVVRKVDALLSIYVITKFRSALLFWSILFPVFGKSRKTAVETRLFSTKSLFKQQIVLNTPASG
jgi:hypothetical protein